MTVYNDRYIFFVMKKAATKGETTRQALIEAAQQLFNKQGYASTGVDHIVASMGVTTGVFYGNFKSKLDVLKAVLDRQIEQSRQRLLIRRADESMEQWLVRSISIYLSPQHRDSVAQCCPLATMSQELLQLNMVAATGLEGYRQEFEDILSDALNRLEPGLGARAPALMSLCIGAIQCARLQGATELSDQYLESTRLYALQLLRPDPLNL